MKKMILIGLSAGFLAYLCLYMALLKNWYFNREVEILNWSKWKNISYGIQDNQFELNTILNRLVVTVDDEWRLKHVEVTSFSTYPDSIYFFEQPTKLNVLEFHTGLDIDVTNQLFSCRVRSE